MMNQIEPVDCAFSLLKILELDAHNNRMDQFQGFAYSDLAHSWHWPSTSSMIWPLGRGEVPGPWRVWHRLFGIFWGSGRLCMSKVGRLCTLLLCTFVLRGRRGTYGTGLGLVTRLVPLWHRDTSHGRRGTWWHPSSFHVAGVALDDIHLRFAWQALCGRMISVSHSKKEKESCVGARIRSIECNLAKFLKDVHYSVIW